MGLNLFSKLCCYSYFNFSSVQSCPTLCDPMNHRSQASLSITISWSLAILKSNCKMLKVYNAMISYMYTAQKDPHYWINIYTTSHTYLLLIFFEFHVLIICAIGWTVSLKKMWWVLASRFYLEMGSYQIWGHLGAS